MAEVRPKRPALSRQAPLRQLAACSRSSPAAQLDFTLERPGLAGELPSMETPAALARPIFWRFP